MKVCFKSSREFYIKECCDIKNNTVRKRDSDERFDLLDKFNKRELLKLDIEISCVEYPELRFYREIKDVSIYEDLYIISFL